MQFKIEGNRKYKIVQLRVKNLKEKSIFNVSYSWMYGDYKVNSNNFAYSLPYQLKKSFIVGQGFNTKKTHKDLNKYAIDWNMTIGTPVHAARSGYVIDIKENSNIAGKTKQYLDKANYIKILHNDGSFGVYAHLKYKGIIVKEGQYVSKGSLIGYSGNTGYSSGPHLHFHVGKPYLYEGKLVDLTIPFQFRNCKNRKTFTPQVSKKYTAC